jgi:OmpA-OmpF porin, OOP family
MGGIMLRSIRVILLLASALLLANAAQAQSTFPKGWYGGVSVGQSQVNIDSNVLPITNAGATSLSTNDTDTAYKIFGGYRFLRNLAVEAGYMDFGKFSATRTENFFGGNSVRADIKSSGFFGEVVGILPTSDRFDLFAKLGFIATSTKTNVSSTGFIILTGPTSASKSEVNLLAGIGAEYRFTNQLGLRVEYEQAFDVGDANTTGEGDIGVFSLGLTYRF